MKFFKKKMLYWWVKSFMVGAGFSLGAMSMTLFAVSVTGAFNSFFSGQLVKSSELNANFSILKTAIESIPDWTKSGADALYSGGGLIISTSARANSAVVTVNGSISSSILGIYCGNTLSVGTNGSFASGITNGSINFSGFTGYIGAKKACESACGNGNAHMCTSHEIAISRQLNASFANIDMWYSAGSFAVDQTASLTYNDCSSWKSAVAGEVGGVVCSSPGTCGATGRIFAKLCTTQNAVACCL